MIMFLVGNQWEYIILNLSHHRLLLRKHKHLWIKNGNKI